jgi:transcriptional regulator with XRE-family HTH domain
METFGVLLRRHRVAAVLTQERLAERARISATGIAALEAGRRRAPRASTIGLLLDALDLTDSDRAELIAAAAASTTTVARDAGQANPPMADPGRRPRRGP